jgi:hypothetical protein
MAKTAYYQVRESFVGTSDGEPVEYYKGEVIAADDPALKRWPESFVPLVVRGQPPEVEQATAAPGEKRGA